MSNKNGKYLIKGEKGKWEVQNPNPKMCISHIEGKYVKQYGYG